MGRPRVQTAENYLSPSDLMYSGAPECTAIILRLQLEEVAHSALTLRLAVGAPKHELELELCPKVSLKAHGQPTTIARQTRSSVAQPARQTHSATKVASSSSTRPICSVELFPIEFPFLPATFSPALLSACASVCLSLWGRPSD